MFWLDQLTHRSILRCKASFLLRASYYSATRPSAFGYPADLPRQLFFGCSFHGQDDAGPSWPRVYSSFSSASITIGLKHSGAEWSHQAGEPSSLEDGEGSSGRSPLAR